MDVLGIVLTSLISCTLWWPETAGRIAGTVARAYRRALEGQP